MVLQAIHQSVWGPSFQCRIKQVAYLGQHQAVVEGGLLASRGGEWTDEDDTSTQDGFEIQCEWLQVSDGRLVWTSNGPGEARAVFTLIAFDKPSVTPSAMWLIIPKRPSIWRSAAKRKLYDVCTFAIAGRASSLGSMITAAKSGSCWERCEANYRAPARIPRSMEC